MKKNKKIKFLFLVLFSVLLFSILTDKAKAGVTVSCEASLAYPCPACGANWLITGGSVCVLPGDNYRESCIGMTSYCESGNYKCKKDKCYSGYNGQTCAVYLGCTGNPDYVRGCSGVWDTSHGQCEVCNGKVAQTVLADTNQIFTDCNCTGADIVNHCETACKAPSDLDDQFAGWPHIKNVSCNPSTVYPGDSFNISYEISGAEGVEVQTIERDGTRVTCFYDDLKACTWNSKSITLTAPTTIGTYTYTVKAYTGSYPGDCGKSSFSGSSGSCTINVVSPSCSGNLSVSVSGSGTCTVTASVTTTNCDGKSWAIKDDGTTKCSGTVSGSSYATSCSWTVSVGNYTYNLYVGGEKKDTKSANCTTTQKYSLTITKLGNCSGKVKNSGINCGTDCYEEYSNPTNVTLTATPDSSCYFGGWGGACSGTQSTCQLTVDSEKTVTATFSTCKPVGASCSSNNECCSGICKDGKCYCKADGESCSSGKECCSGLCSGGFCATPGCWVDSFTLTPSSVPPNELVIPSARVWNYLGGCGDLPPIYFKAGSCTGPTVSSCILTFCRDYLCCSGNPFVAPSTIGNYIYYACIQKSRKSAVLKVSDCDNECKQRGYLGGICKIGTIPAYFGDGSDGDEVFSSNGTIDTDKNYENLTINSGVKVTVKSGVKIRVRGTLKVYGVLSGTGQGGKGGGCAVGKNGTCSGDFGGKGGKGGNSYYGKTGGSGGNYGGGGGAGGGKVYNGYNGGSRCGGGGGTCTSDGSYVWGGSGGGEIDIYARRIEIYGNGKIESSGTNGGESIYSGYGGGGGGGGGKIYIYFGSGGFKNLGTIEAKGGNGALGYDWRCGGGGGGGGGYIKVVGPTDAILGKTDVSGGKGGEMAQYSGMGGEKGSVAKEIDLSLADTPTSCLAGEVSIGDDNCGKNVNCCCEIVPHYTLSVTTTGTGSGKVTSSPAGINCGTDCSELYPSGTSVILTATPAADSIFAGWSGDCSGTGSCTLTMDSDKSVTATFRNDCPSHCASQGYQTGECKILFFGTGADGSVTFAGNATITSDKNYQDLTINSGVKVVVKSGVTIRVRGTLTLNGAITSDGQGGSAGRNGPGTEKNGGKGGKGGGSNGGAGGNYAGGGGGGGTSLQRGGDGGSYSGGGGNGGNSVGSGGAGGGLIKIYAWRFLIGNSGQISSNGANGGASWIIGGGGGGGGGKIYLYFGEEFSNSGLISAKGGNGGNGGYGGGGGGGGGGGYVKISGPTSTSVGNVDVSGGSGGRGTSNGDPGESGSVETAVDQNLAHLDCPPGQENIGQAGCNLNEICCCSRGNQPPTVSNPSETQNHCAWGSTPQVAPGLGVTLHWTYSDPDGDPSDGYEVWIDTDSNFHNGDPRFKFKVEGIPSTAYTVDLSQNQSTRADRLTYPLSWNTTYYWKVKAKDSAGNWSVWSSVDFITTPSHASPYINFKWDPQKPLVNQVVQFTDLSECYDSSDRVVPCSSWYWTFQNGNPSSSTKQNPTTTFSSVGSNLVTLKVTDSSGYWCEGSKTVTSTYPLPFWKEIPPIFFKMRDFFASLVSKFKLF